MKLISTQKPSGNRFTDHSGEIINGIKLLQYKGLTIGKHHVYECKCLCGNYFDADISILRDTRRQSSCGCLSKKTIVNKTDIKYRNMIGKKIWRLTVVEYKRVNNGIRDIPYFRCKCECGNEIETVAAAVLSGHTKSCGCYKLDKFKSIDRGEYEFPKNHISQIGEKYGNLTIIDCIRKNNENFFKCHCDCGNEIETRVTGVLSGKTVSCGCYRRSKEFIESVAKKSKKHGFSHTRIYHIYKGMIDRCYNENALYYKKYGGRGIRVCDNWLNKDNYEGLKNFYNWALDNGYEKDLTIDRIDNDGPYAPWNCRWVTQTIQNINKGDTVYISFTQLNDNDESVVYTFPLSIWSKLTGLNRGTINSRLRKKSNKWTVETALTTDTKGNKIILNFEPYLEYNTPDKYDKSIHD